jgi:hypothetical protein
VKLNPTAMSFGAAALSLTMVGVAVAVDTTGEAKPAPEPKPIVSKAPSALAITPTPTPSPTLTPSLSPTPSASVSPTPKPASTTQTARPTRWTSRTGTRAPLVVAGGPRQIGQAAVQAKGWSDSQWKCLDVLWDHESGWNPRATNPSSGAYGIAQFLDSTWSSTGVAKTSSPAGQIKAGLIYIERRYGTPCAAWAFWQKRSWY